MPKPKKPVVKITFTVDKEIADMIDNFHEKTSIPKVKIVEKAVKRYINVEDRKYDRFEKEYAGLVNDTYDWSDD